MLQRIFASVAVVALAAGAGIDALAQRQRPAPPAGNRISARDGDIVLVDDDARIRVVRRREGTVRALVDRTDQWLMLLVDYAGQNGADGRVDATYTFRSVNGEWPLEERWHGAATIEEYSVAGENGFGELGLWIPGGLIQMLNERNRNLFAEAGALAIIGFNGSGRSSGARLSFDDTEQREVEQLRRNLQAERNPQAAGRSGMGLTMGVRAIGPGQDAGSTNATTVTYPLPAAPIRVGSNIQTPRKIVDVPPVMPADAIRAGIRGVVILDVVIDTDGTVKSTRVLRSIPMLDQAAIDAVRQWKYEPVLLNGRAVPVIIAVPVSFPQ